MDRALKERIIGAIVLVVFVVLVVPVFLDGPSNENEVISERVPLPGQDDQQMKKIILDRDRTEPVPSGVESESSQPVADIQAAPEPEPEPEKAPEPEPESEPETPVASTERQTPPAAPEPAADPPPKEAIKIQRGTGSATGMYAVQLGSFSSAENANRLAADLRQKGFAAFLSKTVSGGKELHRVRIGPQKDKPAAEAMASRLKDAGHTGQVVPHP